MAIIIHFSVTIRLASGVRVRLSLVHYIKKNLTHYGLEKEI